MLNPKKVETTKYQLALIICIAQTHQIETKEDISADPGMESARRG